SRRSAARAGNVTCRRESIKPPRGCQGNQDNRPQSQCRSDSATTQTRRKPPRRGVQTPRRRRRIDSRHAFSSTERERTRAAFSSNNRPWIDVFRRRLGVFTSAARRLWAVAYLSDRHCPQSHQKPRLAFRNTLPRNTSQPSIASLS